VLQKTQGKSFIFVDILSSKTSNSAKNNFISFSTILSNICNVSKTQPSKLIKSNNGSFEYPKIDSGFQGILFGRQYELFVLKKFF
jgi:hypothetical protein